MESFLGPLAQWLEPPAHNRSVLGSSPRWPTKTRKSEPCANWRWVRIFNLSGEFEKLLKP